MTTAPRKVLLIDSEMLIHLAVSQAYQDSGPYFITASSAGEALKKMDVFTFDLFLLALDLKDQNSFKLLKIIDERFPDAPVILMINDNSEYCTLIQRIEEAKKQGSWQLIEKPFNLDILTVLIERCLFERDRSKAETLAEKKEFEQRNHLRRSRVETLQMSINIFENGQETEKTVKATLTDVSDGGLGLITKYQLEKSQQVSFEGFSAGKSGVIAWTAAMENQIYRAGVQFC